MLQCSFFVAPPSMFYHFSGCFGFLGYGNVLPGGLVGSRGSEFLGMSSWLLVGRD